MRYLKTPENFETLHENYLSVGYYHNKAIVKDELGRLYFARCGENEAPEGTLVSAEIIEPVEKLSREERQSIWEIYGEKDH